jgi:hypothetical protein
MLLLIFTSAWFIIVLRDAMAVRWQLGQLWHHPAGQVADEQLRAPGGSTAAISGRSGQESFTCWARPPLAVSGVVDDWRSSQRCGG